MVLFIRFSRECKWNSPPFSGIYGRPSCISLSWAFWTGCCSEAVRSQVCQTSPLQSEGSRESVCFPSTTHSLLLKDIGAKSKDATPYGAYHANTSRPSSGGPFPIEPHQLQEPKDEPSSILTTLAQQPTPSSSILTCTTPYQVQTSLAKLLAWLRQGKCSSMRQQGGSWGRKDHSLRPLGCVKYGKSWYKCQ